VIMQGPSKPLLAFAGMGYHVQDGKAFVPIEDPDAADH